MKNVTQILVVHSESLPSSLMRSLFVRVLIAFFRIHRFLSGRMFTDQRVWFRMIGSELVPGYRLSWFSFFNRHYICFTEDKAVSLASFFLISRDER